PGEVDVYIRRYSSSGSPLTAISRVNTSLQFGGDQTAPAIAMDDAGNFVVVWDATFPLISGHAVYGRRFFASGTPRDAAQFAVDTVANGQPTMPSAAMDADGDFVITWQTGLPGANREVKARRFAKTGAALDAGVAVDVGGAS